MFFLIPIGHDELTLRGLPFATIGLMVTLIIAFALTIGSMVDEEAESNVPAKAAPLADKDAVHLDETGEVIEGDKATRGDAAAASVVPPRHSTIARRWGYVPASPGVGILTHLFLHPGVVQLVLNLIFLWIAGAKLEELWSRPVFLGAFALFGVSSALVAGGAASDSMIPIVGASGAIAGLMGAMLVRGGRSKIHFAYFVWLGLKPRVGTFEAPAYIMPPLWLVTQLGVMLTGMTVGVVTSGTAFAQWIAGFAFGAAAAFALKRLRFEERVLKRQPETRIDPEDLPLVAFQRKAEPARTELPEDRRLAALAGALVGFDRTALRFELASGAALEVASSDVRAWTVGRLARVDAGDATLLDGAVPPRAPAIVLAFVVAERKTGATAKAIVVDAALLKYATLLDGPAASPKEAFFRLTSQLNVALPGAAFAGDRSRVRSGSLPEFNALRDFLARLEDARAVLEPSARS